MCKIMLCAMCYVVCGMVLIKEMFYLTIHSTHFIYGYMAYGYRHMAKDQLDSERGNPLPPLYGHSFQLVARDLLHASSHRRDSAHHDICYTSGGVLGGTQNSSVGPS